MPDLTTPSCTPSGLVGGQIVDAYAGIRERERFLAEDAASTCMLCSLDRISVDTIPEHGGFDNHVEQHHNLWNYLFYVHYLLEVKPAHEYSGIDDHVIRKLTSVDVSLRKSFLPAKDCAALQHAERADANTEALDELMTALARTEEKMDRILTFQAMQTAGTNAGEPLARTRSQPDLLSMSPPGPDVQPSLAP